MGSDSKLGACAQVFRWIFLFFNLIFLLVGIAVFSLGVYFQVTSQNYSFITGSDVVSLAVVFIVAGLFTGLLAGVGFVGACLKWRPLLVIFAFTMGIILLLEVITGAVAVYFRNTLEEQSSTEYRSRLNETIRNYRLNPDDSSYDETNNNALDTLQNTLECCGTDGPSDWGELNGDYIFENSNNAAGQLPRSCGCTLGESNCARVSFTYIYNGTLTMTFNGTTWTRGCYDATLDYAFYSTIVLGAVGLAFGVLEIAGIFIAIALCCCITMGKREEYV